MNRILGRKKDHREHLLQNLASSLILHEQLNTTLPKAKELRKVVEPLITLGKKAALTQENAERLALYRLILARVGNQKKVAKKLVAQIGPRVQNRAGGYLQILKTGFRLGDGAPAALVRLVDREEAVKKEEKADNQKQKDRKIAKEIKEIKTEKRKIKK